MIGDRDFFFISFFLTFYRFQFEAWMEIEPSLFFEIKSSWNLFLLSSYTLSLSLTHTLTHTHTHSPFFSLSPILYNFRVTTYIWKGLFMAQNFLVLKKEEQLLVFTFSPNLFTTFYFCVFFLISYLNILFWNYYRSRKKEFIRFYKAKTQGKI